MTASSRAPNSGVSNSAVSTLARPKRATSNSKRVASNPGGSRWEASDSKKAASNLAFPTLEDSNSGASKWKASTLAYPKQVASHSK